MRYFYAFIAIFISIILVSCNTTKENPKKISKTDNDIIDYLFDDDSEIIFQEHDTVDDDDITDFQEEDTIIDEDVTNPPTSIEDVINQADLETFTSNVEFIAQERVIGSDHWQAVQDLCVQTFTDLGFTVELHDFSSGVNVIGTKPGSSKSDVSVIVSAHYDHVADCKGADDNASGVAALFETARLVALNNYKKTFKAICWDAEEIGLIGSTKYANREYADSALIDGVFVYETMAYTDNAPNSQSLPNGFDLLFPEAVEEMNARDNRGDFIALIADEKIAPSVESIVRWGNKVDLPVIPMSVPEDLKMSSLTTDLRRSDHRQFWKNDYPAMMITDTANFRNPYYHCMGGEDDVSTLDLEFALKVTQATTAAAMELLEIEE